MTRFFREANLRIRLRKGDFTGYVGTVNITGLRVSFSIIKSLAWSTNSAVVKVWNLSQANRNLIKDYGDEVTLYAGYRDAGGPQVLLLETQQQFPISTNSQKSLVSWNAEMEKNTSINYECLSRMQRTHQRGKLSKTSRHRWALLLLSMLLVTILSIVKVLNT